MAMSLIGKSEDGDDDYTFDGLVICDEADVKDLETSLKPLVESENISLCYVFDGKEPNLPLIKNVDNMRKHSRCIIFYISAKFCASKELEYVTVCVTKPVWKHKIISLITNESIQKKEKFLWLASSVSIYQSSTNWMLKLAKAIKAQSLPVIWNPIPPQNILEMLRLSGHDVSKFKWNVHGVMVQMGKQVLQVDLNKFALHVEDHKKLQTGKVCAECSQLRSGDTSVELMIEKKVSFSSMVEKCTKEFVSLCSSVIDVIEPYENNTVWSLGCTVRGKPIEDNTALKRLFNDVHYGLAERGLGIINKIFHPNYSGKDSRIKSFEGKWPFEKLPKATQLADAGFFFSKAPQETRCYHCGVCVVAWDTNDDPWLVHAGVCPYCPYIKSNMSVERIEEAKQLAVHEHEVLSNMYDSTEARIESFHTFDTKHLKDFETCGKDRNTLIGEFAKAGFYFNGSVDLMKCFSCGLVLSSINPEDDISYTHARIYPHCNHIENLLGKTESQAVIQSAINESNVVDKKSQIVFLLRTLDNNPRREWPFNIFRPV